MNTVLLTLLSLATQIVAHILRFLGFGATALPGLWVERYAPHLLAHYAKYYERIVLVTGTNGKTTTQLTIAAIAKENGWEVVNNKSGSNMLRGIASTLLAAGVPRAHTLLLCEVEEATMPRLTHYITPDYIVVTNIFRDQLDAYGELHKTAQYIAQACTQAPKAVLIANADDPVLATFLSPLLHTKRGFSLGNYAQDFLYEGEGGGDTLPVHIRASEITPHEDLSSHISIEDTQSGSTCSVTFAPPGLFNVYNMLAAFTLAHELGCSREQTCAAIARVSPPFGRGERIHIQQAGKAHNMYLLLVKNPAGFSQVWRMLHSLAGPIDVIFGLNDRIADGRDVSWIWDIKLPAPHAQLIRHMYTTGTRAEDMALRIKYAEIPAAQLEVIGSIEECITRVIAENSLGRPSYLLMTYTAINEARKALGRYVDILPYIA